MTKKKKKKVKAGILKRKTAKQNRKKQQQKQTPKGAKLTEKKVQQFLGKIAVYVFTPEIFFSSHHCKSRKIEKSFFSRKKHSRSNTESQHILFFDSPLDFFGFFGMLL